MAGESVPKERTGSYDGQERRHRGGRIRLPRVSATVLVSAAGIAVAVAILVMTALTIWQARVVTLRNAQRNHDNLAQALAETTGAVFTNVDLLLVAMVERVAAMDPAERVESENLYKLLLAQTSGHPQVEVLGLFDAKGQMWASTRSLPTPRLDSSREEYFTVHRDNPGSAMHIAPPRKGRVDGKWYIFTSRPLRDGRGRLLGVAGALIRPAYLTEMFHRIFPHEGGSGAVELRRSDGILMASHAAAPSPVAGDAGNPEAGLGAPATVAVAAPRLAAKAEVPGYPLHIRLSTARADILANWRRSAAMVGAVAIGGAGLILFLTFGMARQTKRQEVLDLRMRANEARLTQAQAIAHLGHWEWNMETNESQWSDEMFRILGFLPGQIEPSYEALLAAVPAEDRPQVIEALEGGLRGDGTLALGHRIQRPDGEVRHVVMRAESLPAAPAAPPRMVGTLLDASELKRAEEDLERFRYLVENVGQEVWVVRLDGRIAFANAAAAKSLGYSVDELLTKSVTDLDEDGGASFFARRASCADKDSVLPFEINHVAKDGTLIPKEISAARLTVGAEEVFCAFARDIRERKRVEAILQQAQFVIDHMRDSALWVDEDARFLYVNRSACEGLGYTPEELLQRSVLDINPTFDQERWRDYWAGSSLHDAFLLETVHRARDGRVFPVEVAITPMSLDGRVVHCAFARDISDRKQAEAALKESEERLRLALAAGKLGFFDFDLRAGRARISPDYARILGVELLGEDFGLDAWRAMVHPEDVPQVEALLAACIAGQCDHYRIEYRLRTSTGKWIWVVSMGEVVGKDEAGKAVRVVGIHADITERKDAEQALRESEAQYRALFDALTEGIALQEIVWSETGEPVDYRITGVNRSYTAQLGIGEAQALGALASKLYREEGARMLEQFHGVARSGESRVFEAHLPGRGRHFQVSAVVPKAGQLATVFEDVTERKRQEEEAARFTYAVSHDLKSPLVTIRTFLDFLEQDMASQDAERIAKDMGFMRHAAERMARLLDELLALSRVGRVAQAAEDVAVQDVVEEALGLVAGRMASRRVDVQATCQPLILHGDRPRLVEVFQNLLDNAVKFLGDEPAPRVEIGAEERGGEIVLYVRDNGIGIDPRHKERLFGLFEKLDPSADGTGIGLALVKRIVEVHGGHIWVESAGPGKGAEFRFTLAGTRRPD